MPRVARVVAPGFPPRIPPGFPHHITQRGNNRQDVFSTTDNRQLYLRLLLKQRKKSGARNLY